MGNLQRVVEDFKSDDNQTLHQLGEEFNETGNSNRHQVGEDLEMPIEFGQVPWGQHVYIFTHSHSVTEALFYIEKTIENGWSRAGIAEYKLGMTKKAAEMLPSESELQRIIDTYDASTEK